MTARKALLAAAAFVASALIVVASLAWRSQTTVSPGLSYKPVGEIGFQCRLPIGNPIRGRGGFISLPGGSFVADASSLPSYDATVSRWFDVEPNAMAADGRTYATTQGSGSTTTIHLVEAATGRSRQVWTGEGTAQILAYRAEGLYFDWRGAKPRVPGPAFGLWVISSTDDRPRFVGGDALNQIVWTEVSERYAWGTRTSQPLAMIRLELRTGKTDTWLMPASGQTFQLLGVYIDEPVIEFFGPIGRSVALVPEPDHAVLLPVADAETGFYPGFRDSHGLWLTTATAIWLYTRQSGLKKLLEVGTAQPRAPSSLVDRLLQTLLSISVNEVEAGPSPQPDLPAGPCI